MEKNDENGKKCWRFSAMYIDLNTGFQKFYSELVKLDYCTTLIVLATFKQAVTNGGYEVLNNTIKYKLLNFK